MLKVIGDLIKDNVNIDDKVISESMMTAAKDGAMLYLTSALTSTTPELSSYSISCKKRMVKAI